MVAGAGAVHVDVVAVDVDGVAAGRGPPASPQAAASSRSPRQRAVAVLACVSVVVGVIVALGGAGMFASLFLPWYADCDVVGVVGGLSRCGDTYVLRGLDDPHAVLSVVIAFLGAAVAAEVVITFFAQPGWAREERPWLFTGVELVAGVAGMGLVSARYAASASVLRSDASLGFLMAFVLSGLVAVGAIVLRLSTPRRLNS